MQQKYRTGAFEKKQKNKKRQKDMFNPIPHYFIIITKATASG
jgi:hypothetical protein